MNGEPSSFEYKSTTTREQTLMPSSYMTKETRSYEDPERVGFSTPPSLMAEHDHMGGANVGDIARQHYEWSQELESVDQKQADLVVLQWKLVRNQTGMLAQQLVDVRKQVEALDKNQASMNTRVDTVARESESFEQRIKGFVRQLFDRLEQTINRVKTEVDTNAKKREDAEQDMNQRLSSVQNDINMIMNRKTGSPMDEEVKRIRAELSAHQNHTAGLREMVQNQVDELKQAYDQLLDHQRKVSDRVDRGDREWQQAHEDLHNNMRGMIDKERTDRDLHNSKFLTHISNLQNELASHREELPRMQERLQDAEERSAGNNKEHLNTIDARLAEPIQRLKENERRLEHMQASIQQESVARHSLAEVFEQMIKTERTKLTNLVNQKAAFAKLDSEELAKTLNERLDNEINERGNVCEGLSQALARLKNTVQERFAAMEKDTGHEGRIAQVIQEVRDIDQQTRKSEDQLLSMIRDTRKEMQAALGEERGERERGDSYLEEQIEWINDYYDKMHNVLQHKGARNKMMMRGDGRSTPMSTTMASSGRYRDVGGDTRYGRDLDRHTTPAASRQTSPGGHSAR
eukprot:TRINITY_DN37477_c0_g1_i1.p1 TRINITY_DN37477_c0_g1~~TRINITY_DN37477_c0_g1_i1.p1  ORF type:complete len:575 (-),score=166.70 TRINITY_DN37477_c0_g1_i1:270-1994(-)